MDTRLKDSHQTTYEAILQHPVSRSLRWPDVRSMLIALADTVQEYSDVLRVTRNGRSLVLHRPSRNVMSDISLLMKVRLFIEHSDAVSSSAVDGEQVLDAVR